MKRLSVIALILTAMLTLLVSCGGGGGGGGTTAPTATTPPATTPAETYTVSFVIDGVSTSVEVREGELPVYAGALPADKVDGKKTYRFAGWDKEIAPADGDATYTAVFKRVLTLRWVYAFGIVSSECLADTLPVPPEVAAGDMENESTIYLFQSWGKELAPISEAEYDAAGGTVVYTALYEELTRSFTATFKHNGEILCTTTVLYGEKPVFEGVAPTKEGYNYCGWTNADKPAESDVVCESFFTIYDAEQLQWSYNRDNLSFEVGGKNDNRGSVFEEASGLIYMLLEIRYAPSDSTYVPLLKERVIESMKYFMSDEGCMAFFSLEPYWCYVPLSALTLLASEMPIIWDALTDLEREKYDFMMKSLAYVLNYGNSDGNSYKTGPGFRGNFHKSWNPNYRLANVIPMLFIGQYLGGAEKLDALLADFSYDATVAKFNEYGWTRAVKEWTATPPTYDGVTAPTQKETMENGGSTFFVSGNKKTSSSGAGVRIPFRWGGKSSDDIAGILRSLFDYNYSGGAVISEMMCRANANSEWERAYILDGTKSPYEGMDGMMLELGKEDRSSVNYARDDFAIVCVALAVLDELDLYDVEKEGLEDGLFNRLWVGNMDFIYKFSHGYKTFATSTTPYSKSQSESSGLAYYVWKSWWMNEYGNKYTKDTLPNGEKTEEEEGEKLDPNLYVESFDGLDFSVTDASNSLALTNATLNLNAASPMTGTYSKTVVDPANPANKYLALGIDHGAAGLNVNLQAKGGLTALGDNRTMRISMKIAKNPDADSFLESTLRLRAADSNDTINIFSTSTSGKLTAFGRTVTTLTNSFQEIVITIDFKTGATSISVDGTEKVSITMTLAEHHKKGSSAPASDLLAWTDTTAGKSYIFNWYVKANASTSHRGMLIDDFSCTAILE